MSYLLLILTFLGSANCVAQNVFLNEIRANDASTDNAEFVELIGPAGADISGWAVLHINGSGGSEIFRYTFPENTVFPNDGVNDSGGNPVGFLVIKNTNHDVPNADFNWGLQGLQNGPDGILLENAEGVRIQALTYNGSGDLSGGTPAWRNIGADANDDRSLSAPDDVTETSALTWSLQTASPGYMNANQMGGDISLPVQLSSFVAIGRDNEVLLKWQTESEVNNLGFIIHRSTNNDSNMTEIAHYLTCNDLKGSGSSSTTSSYSFRDITVYNGKKYFYRLSDVDINGNITTHSTVLGIPHASGVELKEVNDAGLPVDYQLDQNFPNPFNPSTKIQFQLPKPDEIDLAIYNITGKKIVTLYLGYLGAGFYELNWHGKNHAGRQVTPGIYFYTFQSRNYFASRKMVLLK
jgi:hypothetical protein